jgi:hypothetical protein
MRLIGIVALVVAAHMLNVANAAAFKCVDRDGKVSFSEMPCPANAVKGEKIMERGAGYSHLTKDEKRQFNAGVMSQCNGPRNVCACFAEYLSDELSYEELMQFSRQPKAAAHLIQDKGNKAMKYCIEMKPK